MHYKIFLIAHATKELTCETINPLHVMQHDYSVGHLINLMTQ